jgi:hypothetical protein
MPNETPLFHSLLTPALALVVLSLIVWAAMVATRIPAMAKAKMPPQSARYTAELTTLPAPTRDIGDNYKHLMEQPTIFYALVFYSYLAGQQDGLNIALAWAYVGIRVVHTAIQTTTNIVMLRFYAFLASSLVLVVIAARDVAALFN